MNQRAYQVRQMLANNADRGHVWLAIGADDARAVRVLHDSRGTRFVFVENRARQVTKILKDTLAREFARLLP